MNNSELDFENKFPGCLEHMDRMLSGNTRPRFGPLDHNPCANIVVANAWVCPNPGTMACSACKLVSYCSKECQKAHWKKHKKDCNDHIRTGAWRPVWEKECRPPSFINSSVNNQDAPDSPLSAGMTLWGNTPAVDLINLEANENDTAKDFSLAFVASGDLRHAMKTINSLPLEFKGHLKILINDFNPLVVSRNLALLLTLGQISDEALAADVALHFWYSIFMPVEYSLMISAAIVKYIASLSNEDENFKLGPSSTLSGKFLNNLDFFLRNMVEHEEGDVERAQAEYLFIREHPSRQDLRDRMYSRLRPSHRLAFKEYRRFGLVLPFGAINAHFNVQNRSLFSFDGSWVQTDFADPLEGWDINDIVEAGRAHGANVEDIYGCFYFFISDHLRTLWRRLRSFKISFIMTNIESGSLASAVSTDQLIAFGISPSSGFDRIHVSNIMDTIYVGLEGVLNAWAPLLSVSKTAAIVGYFMNWVGSQKGGRVVDLPRAEICRLMERMENEGKAKFLSDWQNEKQSLAKKPPLRMTMRLFNDVQIAIFFMMSNIDFVYDNSGAFSTFLQKQGLNLLVKKRGIKLRKKHTIVPQRIGTSFASAPSDLPRFDKEDSWYYQSSILGSTGFERFVEFACI